MKFTKFGILVLAAVTFIASCAKEEKVDEINIRVATYNVDGLPVYIPLGDGVMGRFVKEIAPAGTRVDEDYNLYINEDGPGGNGSLRIAANISDRGWDIFGFNEDFNYHTEICSGLNGYSMGTYQGGFFVNQSMYVSLLEKFNNQKPLFEIDGLEFGVKGNSCTMSGEVIVPWNPDAVYGYISNGSDELTRKGFRYYQVLVKKSGVEASVDFIILHTDAGSAAEDIAAREKAYDQLLEFIKGIKTGNPLILMGDWNTKYYRDNFKGLFIDKLNSIDGINVRDAWVEYCNGGVYPQYGGSADSGKTDEVVEEKLDKILFLNRSDSPVELKLVSTENIVDFVNDDGKQLSDHLPVEASFRIVKRVR